MFAAKDVKHFVGFIKAREAARLHKEREYRSQKEKVRAEAKLDPIIRHFRFCNVRRNDDRVTKYVLEKYLPKFNDTLSWFAATVARLFNNEEVLEEIKDAVVPFQPKLMKDLLHLRKVGGKKNFNPAYIVSTNGRAMDKVDYVVAEILEPLWRKRAAISAALRDCTLAQAHDLLTRQNGLGSFMAAQILADIKYIHPSEWVDFHTFAASGPGSKRGMNRLLNLDIGTPCTEGRFRERIAALREDVNKRLSWDPPLTAQDLQNCLCEFDKYERARLGEGTPKQIYKPKENGK